MHTVCSEISIVLCLVITKEPHILVILLTYLENIQTKHFSDNIPQILVTLPLTKIHIKVFSRSIGVLLLSWLSNKQAWYWSSMIHNYSCSVVIISEKDTFISLNFKVLVLVIQQNRWWLNKNSHFLYVKNANYYL